MKRSMAPKENLRRLYSIHLELGFVIVLALLIATFHVPFDPDLEVCVGCDWDLHRFLSLSAPIERSAIPVTRQPWKPPPTRQGGVEEEPEIFIVVEQMPELIGGISSIQSHLKYPEVAWKAGVQGLVIVQFVVDEQGRVSDPVVAKGIGGGCDEEAVRAIMEHATFKPGMQDGKPVRVRFSLPIWFRL